MCKLCDQGQPQSHRWNSRRGFLQATAAGTAAAAAVAGGSLFAPREARAADDERVPNSAANPAAAT